MKVLHIAASMSPEWGGPTKVIAGLTKALVEKGINVSVFAPITDGEDINTCELQGVDIKLFPKGFLSRFWTSYSSPLAKALMREVYNFDLIHIHEIWHHPHYVAHRVAKRFDKPYLVTIHGALEPWCLNYKALKKKIYGMLIQKRILKAASMLHAITENKVKNIKTFVVNNTPPIVMIPNGINLQEFQNLPPKEESLQRDIKERKRSMDSVIEQYIKSVRPMHIEFVESNRRYADIIIPGGYNPIAINMVVSMIKDEILNRVENI